MIGILILTITALFSSIIIVVVDFNLNKKDIIKEEISSLLPGYNCCACGFGSCHGMVIAMTESLENYKKCRYLKGDKLKIMEEFVTKQKK